MARKRSLALTDAEARVMHALWQQQPATVGDIVDALKDKRAHYSTVQTMLRILEAKGYVEHEKVGRAFVYRTLVDAGQAKRRALRHLVARLFNGSPSELVLHVLEDEEIDAAEKKRLKKLIEDA